LFNLTVLWCLGFEHFAFSNGRHTLPLGNKIFKLQDVTHKNTLLFHMKHDNNGLTVIANTPPSGWLWPPAQNSIRPSKYFIRNGSLGLGTKNTRIQILEYVLAGWFHIIGIVCFHFRSINQFAGLFVKAIQSAAKTVGVGLRVMA
jgi:hypothetical protein